MTGATDLFFGLVLAFIVVASIIVALGALMLKIVDKSHEREIKKARAWLLPIFDAQAKEYVASAHLSGHDPKEVRGKLLELRDHLEGSLGYWSDILAFRKKGAPLLLMYFDDGAPPYLLLGISKFTDEVKLGEGSVLGHIPYPKKARELLSLEECVALEVCYPEIERLAEYTYCHRVDVDAPEPAEPQEPDIPDKGRC